MAAVPNTNVYKTCPILADSFLPKLLDDLRRVNPQSALFTVFEKHIVPTDHDIASDLNVGVYEQVSSCLVNEDLSSSSLKIIPEEHSPEQSAVNSNRAQVFHLGSISPFGALSPSISEIKEKAKGIKRKLTFTEKEIQLVENKQGFNVKIPISILHRKGRITASKCKRVASLKLTTSLRRLSKNYCKVTGYLRLLQCVKDWERRMTLKIYLFLKWRLRESMVFFYEVWALNKQDAWVLGGKS